MEGKQLYVFAQRGILAEIDDWIAKREAVAALNGVLTKNEIERMIAGIDQSIEELVGAKENVEKMLKSDQL